MAGPGQPWARLRAFLTVHRAERPLLRPEALSGPERQRGEVLASVLGRWLEENAARFRPRGLWERVTSGEPGHFVYETDPACLALVGLLGDPVPEQVTLVTVEELQAWRADRVEAMAGLYPVVSSFFTQSLPTSLYRRASARHPLRPGEAFWLHCRGVWHGPDTGRGSDDLWKSDGDTMTLLEPRFSRWKA